MGLAWLLVTWLFVCCEWKPRLAESPAYQQLIKVKNELKTRSRVMAYNERLTNRLREALANVRNVEEKRMFSGITFMVNGKMCISAGDDRIMCRIDPAIHDQAIKRKGCTPVMMKGREYRGFVYVREEGIKSKTDFDYWVALALNFNKIAKAARPAKKSQAKRKQGTSSKKRKNN
jgi:TfoX/Sxy family transcriptional regulator of competence genes